MDIGIYATEAAIERDHWWFAGRRILLSQIISEFSLPRGSSILHVGTGTGSNLRMLRELAFDRVPGLDRSREATRSCADKGPGPVELGDVQVLFFPDRHFDLVLAADIIEHVDEDLLALRELRRALKPRGRLLLLTVRAFELLWGLQDEVGHHKRRYRLSDLLERIGDARLSPERHFYFNYLLFLPILVLRRLMRVLPLRVASEGEINAPWLSRILSRLFRLDVRTAPLVRPPFGVSALVVATPA